jgi:hypothetical protein
MTKWGVAMTKMGQDRGSAVGIGDFCGFLRVNYFGVTL